jgi:hypothetical protein
MSGVLNDLPATTSEVIQPSEPPVRVVEVPNRFLSRLLAVAGATLHPFSTTIVRVVERENPISASVSATAETGGANGRDSEPPAEWL